MAFRFALATVLRLRQSVERQRTLQLQDATSQVLNAKLKLTELERSLSDSSAEDLSALGAGRRAAEMHFALTIRENSKLIRIALTAEISGLELLRAKVLAEYQKASRDREVLELLFERQRKEFRRQKDRSLQHEADEAFLLQRWRGGKI